LIGISGGEFGVQCHVTAYDLKTGKQAWRAFSEGPDDQIMVDPVSTTELGKPVGKDSSTKTWQGDQWKIGGGCTWGWRYYEPTLDRATGELLVAEKYDPKVNWTSGVDMNKSSPTYGRPKVVDQYSTEKGGEDKNTKGVCPAALGTKDEQPAAYSPDTQLFYVPTNHVCMDYEPFTVSYTAGQPYVGATLSMYPPQGDSHMGNFIAWDGKTGKIVWSN